MTAWTSEPVAGQIAAHLKRRILAGEFARDTLLSYKDVAEDYTRRGLEGANTGTARHAMAKLREEGLVATYQGKGSIVTYERRDGSDDEDLVAGSLVDLNEAIRQLDQRVAEIEAWRREEQERRGDPTGT